MLSWKLQTYRYLIEKKKEKKTWITKIQVFNFVMFLYETLFCVFS